MSEVVYECGFFIAIILNFFTEFHYSSSQKVERDFKKICYNYLKTSFLFDMAAMVPLRVIFWGADPKYRRLFHLVKLTRL